MKRHRFFILFFGLLIMTSMTVPGRAQNILFYGNSYTQARTVNGVSIPSLPDFVEGLAFIAGLPTPNAVDAAVGGQDFQWHLDNNMDAIDSSLPAGQSWDYVVLQNQSVRPTTSHPSGNLSAHRANGLALYQAVAAHSPGVVPVMFETWAREPDNNNQSQFYPPGTAHFAGGTAQMQSQLRNGYLLAAQDIDVTVGSSITRIAAVGDAWESIGFNDLYENDGTHTNARGRLLSALVMHGTIFGDATRDLASSGALDGLLTGLNLSLADGDELTAAADLVNGFGLGLIGDANADGIVGLLDLDILGQNWGMTASGVSDGDFNADGIVSLLDLDLLGQNWGAGTANDGNDFASALAAVGIPVPEPGIVGLMGMGMGVIGARRRRSSLTVGRVNGKGSPS